MDDWASDSEETCALLREARGGDGRAFDRLFAHYLPRLQRFVELRIDPKLRPRVDPADVVQEAHLEAVRRLGGFLDNPAMPFRLWIRQIALDRLLMMRRRHVGAARRRLWNVKRPPCPTSPRPWSRSHGASWPRRRRRPASTPAARSWPRKCATPWPACFPTRIGKIILMRTFPRQLLV